MGRPKLDTYWYVFALTAMTFVTVGIVKLALYVEPKPSDPDWYSRSGDKWSAAMWIFFGVIAGIMAAQLWAKKVSRIKVPDDIRRAEKRKRKLQQ